jgi:hypothetical protein
MSPVLSAFPKPFERWVFRVASGCVWICVIGLTQWRCSMSPRCSKLNLRRSFALLSAHLLLLYSGKFRCSSNFYVIQNDADFRCSESLRVSTRLQITSSHNFPRKWSFGLETHAEIIRVWRRVWRHALEPRLALRRRDVEGLRAEFKINFWGKLAVIKFLSPRFVWD